MIINLLLKVCYKNIQLLISIKEIYSFYPKLLLSEIGEIDIFYSDLLNLTKLIESYANNENNETAGLFEDVLEKGFNMFFNVEAKRLGGASRTDIECFYLTKSIGRISVENTQLSLHQDMFLL